MKIQKSVSWRAVSILLAVCTLLSVLPWALLSSATEEAPVAVYLNGDPVDTASMSKYDTLELTAKATFAETVTYSWEILVDGNDLWVGIEGKTDSALTVNYGMVESVLNGANTAYIRCTCTDGEQVFSSDPVAISVSDETESGVLVEKISEPKQFVKAPMKAMLGAEPVVYHTISVEYRYYDEDPSKRYLAAQPFVATVREGSSFKRSVTSPTNIVGYECDPEQAVVDFDIESVVEDILVTVLYHPISVKFKVRYYVQDTVFDTYELFKTDTLYANAGSYTPNEALVENFILLYCERDPKNEDCGIYALWNESLLVAADGSTELSLYFDRNYYFVSFALEDDAYGTRARYARYGYELNVNDAIRPGYTLESWTPSPTWTGTVRNPAPKITTGADEKINLNLHVPQFACVFTPKWKQGDTSYRVVYWLENADDNDYSFWRISEPQDSKAGNIVDADTFGATGLNGYSVVTTNATATYAQLYTYNKTKSDHEVIVNGDASTLVNVYYQRKIFELQFVATSDNTKIAYAAHTHTDACYEFCCGLEGHTHTSDCNLICGKTEHIHSADCCTIGHTHVAACYSGSLSLSRSGNTVTGIEIATTPTASVSGTGTIVRTGNNSSNYAYYAHVTNSTNPKFPDGYYEISGSNLNTVYSNRNSTTIVFPDPTCGKQEHDHTEGTCYCSKEEHKHGAECYDCKVEGHMHSDSCKRLICQETDKPVKNLSISGVTGSFNTVYVLRAKYGAKISDLWPMPSMVVDDKKILTKLLSWRSTDALGTHTNGSASASKRMRADIELIGFNNNGISYFYTDTQNSSYTIHLTYDFNELYYNGKKITEYQSDFYSSAGATQYTYSGTVYYDWADPIFGTTNDQVLPTEATWFSAKAIEGMTVVSDNHNNTSNSGTHYYQNLLYKRNEFTVTIYNYNDCLYDKGVPVDANFRTCGLEKVQYGLPYKFLTFNYKGTEYPLSELNETFLTYPSDLEKGAYVFEGWYTTSECLPGTEFDPSKGFITGNLALYAHWIPTTHDVWVFFDNSDLTKDPSNPKLITSANCEKAEDLNGRELIFDGTYPIVVSHGEDLSAKLPIVAQRTDDLQQYLAGWFYIDPETGLETAYYPTIPVTQDMCLYAKWESNKVVQYTIKYILDATEEDIENGYVDGEAVAKTLTGSTLAGRSLTFLAKGEIEWYDKFHDEWLFPNVASHVMYMSSEESENVFTFEYRMVSSDIDYKIVYVDNETGEVITSENRTLYVAQATHKSSILNIPAMIFDAAGTYAKYYYYLPDAYEKQLQLTYTGDPDVDLANNTLYFYYSDPYKEDPADPSQPDPEKPKMAPYQVNFEYEVDGNYEMFSSYNYSIKVDSLIAEDDLAGYLESGKKTGYGQSPSAVYVKTYEYNTETGAYDEISETYTTDKLKELKIPEQGALIVFRYDLLEFNYTVNYLRADNHKVVAEKTTGKAKYGETLVVTAKSVPGYSMPVPSTQREIIYKDEEFTFYYTSGTVTINYQRIGVDLENYTRMLVPPSDLVGYTSGILTFSKQTVDIATGKVVDEDDKAPYNSAEATEGYEFAGWYTAAVDEDGKDDIYDLTLVEKDADFNPEPTVVGEGGQKFYGDITYYALFLPKAMDLTIVRKNAKPDETFIYHIVSKKLYEGSDSVDIYVSIQGNDSVVVKGLSFGEYDIIEESDWSWRYDCKKYENATLMDANNIFTFGGERSNKAWFSDDDREDNKFNGLEAEEE